MKGRDIGYRHRSREGMEEWGMSIESPEYSKVEEIHICKAHCPRLRSIEECGPGIMNLSEKVLIVSNFLMAFILLRTSYGLNGRAPGFRQS